MPISPLALELTLTVLIAVAVVSVVLLVLIVVAPWKEVRAESRIDPDDEARLLLHRDPDEPTGEVPSTAFADFRPVGEDDAPGPDEWAKLDDDEAE